MSVPSPPALSAIAAGAEAHGRALLAGDKPGSDLPGGDLRAALLLAEIDLMAATTAGAEWDRSRAELVLGLIPLVDSETLALAAERSHTRPGMPPAIVAALAPHRPACRGLSQAITLTGHQLARLVEEARGDAELACWLLARAEPTAEQRAALYRFASPAERAAIRASLTERAGAAKAATASLTGTARTELLDGLSDAGMSVWMAAAGFGPSLHAVRAGLLDAAEQELFALGLLALGFDPDAAIRILLAQPPAVSHSIAVVHSLAKLLRSTAPAVARHIADPDDRLTSLVQALRRPLAGSAGPAIRTSRRPRDVKADQSPPRPAASDLPDRRSRATTGLRRT